MKPRFLLFTLVIGTALASACSDDAVQNNPHFATGGTGNDRGGAPAAGENGFGLGGGADVIPNSPNGGEPNVSTGGEPNVSTGGEPGHPVETGSAGTAGAGGAPPEAPVYDCVARPGITHLQIINAPTTATHVEKHPDLPPIPRNWLLALFCGLTAERAHAEVRVSALTQVDWVVHRQSSQDELDPATRAPLNEDRLVLRRGRVGVEGQRNAFGARLELDMNTLKGLSLRPFEALVFARYDRVTSPSPTPEAKPQPDLTLLANAGLMRIPFGFDALEPDAARPLLERADATRAFFGQARDLGVGADVAFRFARLSLAVMNGEPLSDDRYAGLALTRSKDFVGRAGVSTSLSRALWVQAGASCLFGTGLHLGNSGTKDSLQWVDGNEDGQVDTTELIPVAGTPASASKTFERSALGADLRVGVRLPLLGLLVFRSELTRALNLDRGLRPADPVATGRDLRELGVQIGLSQELTRYGEAAVRYDVYQPDADATRQRAASVVPRDARYRTLSFSLAGKLAPARLLLQYDHRRNGLGRALNGAPTTLKDDSLTLRAEVRL